MMLISDFKTFKIIYYFCYFHVTESRNVRSMALLNNEVYIIECLEEVKWTGDYFSSWIITVLNNHGDYVRQFYAGK